MFQKQIGRFLMIPGALLGIATVIKNDGSVGYLNLVKFLNLNGFKFKKYYEVLEPVNRIAK